MALGFLLQLYTPRIFDSKLDYIRDRLSSDQPDRIHRNFFCKDYKLGIT
jgi:hypothetical protein